jgi:hypothetical protein
LLKIGKQIGIRRYSGVGVDRAGESPHDPEFFMAFGKIQSVAGRYSGKRRMQV